MKLKRIKTIIEIDNRSRPKAKECKVKKRNTFDSVNAFYEGRELTLNAFKSEICPLNPSKGKESKILIPKLMLQVKAGNTSENVLNQICQIVYSLYRKKEITNKVYNNMMN